MNWRVLILLLFIVSLPVSAWAQDATGIQVDAIEVFGSDLSRETLADWEDMGLGDGTDGLLRGLDRRLLRLAPGRDERGMARILRLEPYPYDDKYLDRGKYVLGRAATKNTLRNVLLMMFMLQE